MNANHYDNSVSEAQENTTNLTSNSTPSKHRRRGIGCLLWSAFLIIILGSCSALLFSGSEDKSSSTSPTGTSQISPSTDYSLESNPAIGTLLLDDSDIRITLDNIRYNNRNTEFDLLIENYSDDNATLSGTTFIVNGVMIDTFFYAPVASGAKANCTLYFDSSDLITAGIEEIYSVSSYDAHISFEESEGKDIPLKIILREEKTQDIDSSGKVLFEQNGITVISKFDPIKQTDNIPLLVLNESGQDFNIWTEYVTVNGYTVPEWHYSYIVCDGASRFFEIELVSPDMGGSDIDTIETASFALDFKVPGSSASICQTEQLEIP